MNAVEVLQRLSEAFGPPGFEDDVREIIRELVTPLVDDVRTDALGNVIATRRGGRDEPLLLDAHMDEVGFLVSYVEGSGFLRLAALGGWDARILLAHAVTIRRRDGGFVRGVIGTLPPHVLKDEDRKKTLPLDRLFVDVGASSSDEVEAMGLGVGCPAVLSYGFERMSDDLVMGKAFDDRAGCTTALGALDALQGEDLDLTLVTAFTVSEEVGLRGARTAAYQVRPKVALALEGTTAVDLPGVEGSRQATKLAGGPALTIADNSVICDRGVVTLLEETAQKEGIKYQFKTPTFGGTDAGAIHITAEGCRSGVLSVPCRYIHTPLSMLKPSALDDAIRLTTAFVRGAGSLVP